MNNEDLLKLVDLKVANLKTFIRENTQQSLLMVNMILNMVGSDEYLNIGESFLLPLRQKGESFDELINGMIENFTLPDTPETRSKLDKYLNFFCDVCIKMKK